MEKCGIGDCKEDPIYTEPFVVPPLPEDECCGGGGEGGGGGHKYTFVSTATGWQVREDGRVIYSYTDKNDNTTYSWQATSEGWLVKDNKGNVLFTYKDKDNDTTYSFEKKDDCGFKVTNSKGEVVFDYDNDCAGTTYKFEQNGVDFTVTDNKTNTVVFTYKGTVDTTYTFEDYKKGFKVTDSKGVVAYIYDPDFDPSDGSYPIDTLLTTVFKGHTTISTGQIIGFTPANLVVGETLVYDGVGTVGVITKDNGDGTYQVTTMTTSPGTRQGVRLGSVKKEEDLPATCAAAEALGWQTPQLGDFAYVIEGEGTAGDVISEYVITNVDDDCNLTWTFSHSFNAGQYQEQSELSMSGMILTGGAIPGTFGDPIDPSTLIRGVMRNGILLTPDAQGKVNVIVDDSHIIVNALPTTGIVDLAEYVVIDANQKVTGTWVHDATGWYQTYEPPVNVKAHQIVDALPTTQIEEGVEYIIIKDGKLSETWVYDPTKGWVQTEVLDAPAHIVVKDLPTTGIDDTAEYVQVSDLDDPVNTYVASWVHTDKGWVKVAENATAQAAHIAVTALPTTNINTNAEYVVLTDLSDPATYQGTWVRVNNNWVQTDRLENGFHIVTSLPTTNIDDKHDYIVVEDLSKPDETLIGHYAYDSASKKWISLSSKYEVFRGVSLNGYATNEEDYQEMPVGAVTSYFGKTAPAHYLVCDGTVYNVGDYPELEAFLIEQYGKLNQFGGNGTSTWAVPDLRGEFLRGSGTNSHTNTLTPIAYAEGSGSGVGVHQQSTYIPNQYSYDAGNSITLVGTTFNRTSAVGDDSNQMLGADGAPNGANTSYRDLSGVRTGVRTNSMGGSARPTNTSVLWIIKAESTYSIVPSSTVYKCSATLTYNMTHNVMSFPILTNIQDDTNCVKNMPGQNQAFVAPVDGYYAYTFMFGETADIANMSYHAFYVYKNGNTVIGGGDRHDDYETGSGTSRDLRFPLESSGVVKLKKGETIATAVFYATSTGTGSITRTGVATFSMVAPVIPDTSDVMQKPHTWAANTPQDFGDGLYGIRLVFDGSTSTDQIINLSTYGITGITRIDNQGGSALVDSQNVVATLPCFYTNSAYIGMWYNKSTNQLHFYHGSQYSTGNEKFDIWFTYRTS